MIGESPNIRPEELLEHSPNYDGKAERPSFSPPGRYKIRLFTKRFNFSILSQ